MSTRSQTSVKALIEVSVSVDPGVPAQLEQETSSMNILQKGLAFVCNHFIGGTVSGEASDR